MKILTHTQMYFSPKTIATQQIGHYTTDNGQNNPTFFTHVISKGFVIKQRQSSEAFCTTQRVASANLRPIKQQNTLSTPKERRHRAFLKSRCRP